MRFHETDKLAKKNRLTRQVTNARFEMPQGAQVGYCYLTITISETLDAEHKNYRAETYTSVHMIERPKFAEMYNTAMHLALDQGTRKFLAMDDLYVEVKPEGVADTSVDASVPDNVKEFPIDKVKDEAQAEVEKKKTTKKATKKTTKKTKKEELLKERKAEAPSMEESVEDLDPLNDELEPLEPTIQEDTALNEKYQRSNDDHKSVLGGIIDKFYPTWRQSTELKQKVQKQLLPSIVDKAILFVTHEQKEKKLACEEFIATVKKILG